MRNNSARPSNVGIDDIINGLLLRKDLHAALNKGQVAFIKTPNYGLRPEDIKRFQRDGSRRDYITLHRLKEPKNYDPISLVTLQALENPLPATFMLVAAYSAGANVDALFQGQGEGIPLPSTVILDYVYGAAAYQSWHSNGDVSTVMGAYRENHYARIPPLPRNCYPSTRRIESDMAKAMDELNMVLMYVTRGITPEEAAERRQKEIEQVERAAQEASRSKVTEWMKHMDVC